MKYIIDMYVRTRELARENEIILLLPFGKSNIITKEHNNEGTEHI